MHALPDAPEGLDLWSYFLIDGQRHPLTDLLDSKSPLLGLFRLEQLGAFEDLPAVTQELAASLGSENQELAAAFVQLINESILPNLTPPGDQQLRIRELEEVPSMLAQRIQKLTHELKMQGWEKGREEGAKNEAAHLFLELFAAKFDTAPDWVRDRTASASKVQLESWAKRLLRAEAPEDVFTDPSPRRHSG